MYYSQFQNIFLIEELTLSESLVYSRLLSYEGDEAEKFLTRLNNDLLPFITRVTINASIRKLKSLIYIDDNLRVIRYPTNDTTPDIKFHITSGRPRNVNK